MGTDVRRSNRISTILQRHQRCALPQSGAVLARRAADRAPTFPTGKDLGLYARFRWELARQDPHKPHRPAALRAARFAHEESSVRPGLCARSAHSCWAIAGIAPPSFRCVGHSSNKSWSDGDKIIHTRSCNLGVPLNTTSPGQSRGGAGASLLTADRLS